VVRLTGHSGPLSSIAFSPNGQFLASGGEDQVVKVWNVQTKSEVRSFRAHTDWVTSVGFSPDGESIVSASVDQSVLLWRFIADETDVATGHVRKVNLVAMSGNGERIASAGEDRTVRVWNATTGQELRVLTGHSGAITAVAISPDGKRVATAAQDLKIKIWDADSGREAMTHDGMEEVLLLAYSTDGAKLLAWHRQQGRGDDETIDGVTIFDAGNLKSTDALTDRGRRVSSLALAPDGSILALGATDGSVRLWDVVKKERIGGDRPLHAKPIRDLAITPDKTQLITANEDGDIKISPVPKAGESRTMQTTGKRLDGLLVSPDGQRLATFGGGRVELWDLASGKSLRFWNLHGVRAMAFGPGGKKLVVGLDTSVLYLLDLP